MTKARGLLIIGLLLCATPSFAGEVTLDGVVWDTDGMVSIRDGGNNDIVLDLFNTFTFVPSGANDSWALLESGDGDPRSVLAADLEAFLFGASDGSLTSQGYDSGAAIKRFVTFDNATDALNVNLAFATSEDLTFGSPDAAIFVMNSDFQVIASNPLPGGAVGSQFDATIFQPSAIGLGAGTYLIGFAVLNHTDGCCSSFLGVDNFRINDVPLEGLVTDVPEPGTLLLLTAGWGMVFVSRRFFGGPKDRTAI